MKGFHDCFNCRNGAFLFLGLGLFQLAKDLGYITINISLWALLFLALGLCMLKCKK